MSLQTSCPAAQGQHKFTAYHARRLRGFLAVPLSAIREHGQAAQTLAGLIDVLRQDGRQTFRRQADIARAAGLSVRTVRRHLKILADAGLVRIRPTTSTNVVALVADEAELMGGGFLPMPRYVLGRPWAERLLYSWIVFRAEVSGDGASCTDGLVRINKAVGLSRRAIPYAVKGLVAAGLVARERLLDGENGRFELLAPPHQAGGANMSAPRQGSANVSAPGVQKWPTGSAKVADSNSYKKKIQEHGPRRGMDQICVSVEEVASTASDLFRRCRYAGDRGGNLWKLAALLDAGLVSEHEAYDACQGCRECAPRDRPAYAVAILKTHVQRRGGSLVSLLRRVRIEPTWPTGPPADTAW